MTSEPRNAKRQGERNLGASIQQKLRNHARASHADPALVLTRYVIERFLYRLSQSACRERFVLRGATLFSIWVTAPYRSTRDLDLMGFGDAGIGTLRPVFLEICSVPVAEDGIMFLPETLVLEERTEGRAYPGLHLEVTAALSTARPILQVDLSFGEAITPAPEEVVVPAMLGYPPPLLRAYPRETVIAEKSEALVSLGLVNTRLKDFFDLWYLASTFSFQGDVLLTALKATFQRRETFFPPDGMPAAFTERFYADLTKQAQWKAFVTKSGGIASPASLEETFMTLRVFLSPIFLAAAHGDSFDVTWSHVSGWQENEERS